MSAVLKKGSQGPEVVELKRLLEVWGKTHPLPKPLAKTPVFGEATVIDVKAFQESAGLTGDGKVGDLTRLLLLFEVVEVGESILEVSLVHDARWAAEREPCALDTIPQGSAQALRHGAGENVAQTRDPDPAVGGEPGEARRVVQ